MKKKAKRGLQPPHANPALSAPSSPVPGQFTMATPTTPVSPTSPSSSTYPTTGIYALGYLDDTYPHEKIGSQPRPGASPTPTPSSSTFSEKPHLQHSTTATSSSTAFHPGSANDTIGGVKKKSCWRGTCHHPTCVKSRANSALRKTPTHHSILTHDLSTPYYHYGHDLHHPSVYPGIPGGTVAGVHTCDVPHCTSSQPHPQQLTPKQKRHMKRMEERELVAIVLDTLLQIAAFTTAIVFGIWAVKSYNVSVTTLQVQWVANQLSLRSLCTSGNDTLTNDPVCQSVLQQSIGELLDSGFSTGILGGNGAPKINPPANAPPSPGGGHKGLPLGGIVGIVFGVIAFILGNLAVAAWRRFRMLRKVNRHIGTANCVDD